MITKKDAQEALNRSLSGLQSNPYIVQKIITGTKEKAYKRKKLSSTAIIAFVLVGIMASAMATGIAINGKPWGVLNWIFEAQPNSTAVTATQKIYPDSEQILQEATASPSETEAIIPMEVVAISTESCKFDFATLSIREAVTDGYGIYLSIAAVPSNPDILLLDWSINPFESSPEIIGQVSDYQNQTLAEWAVNHQYKQLIRLSIGSPLPEPYTHGRLISSEKYDPDPAIADKQTVQSDGWSYDLVSNGSGFDSYINRRMVLEEDGTSLIMIAGGFMNQKEYEIACFMMPWRMTGDGKEDPADYDFYRNTARKKNIIWDRHTIGELIYPEVFNRKPQIGPEDARLALAYGRENGTKTIVLTAPVHVIKDRLANRGNECQEILSKINFIHDKFIEYAEFLNVPVVDTSGSITDTLSKIIEIIESDDNFKFIHK